MTKVGATLNVQIQPNGAVFPTLNSKEGKVLGDMQDITRIQTMNASLTSERKEAQKADAGMTLQHVIAAVIQIAKDDQAPLARVNSKFLEVYRSVNTQMRTLVSNTEALEAYEVKKDSAQDLIKNMLIEAAARTRAAVGEFLMARASSAEDDSPVKLNSFLRKHLVPAYIYGRLTGAQISFHQTGFDISSVIFPSDPSKGFYLTWREINSDLVGQLGGLLGGADMVIKLAHDHSLIRKLINVGEETNLTDFETTNSFASKIAGTPFLIPPFAGAVSSATIFKFLAKNGSRGIQFQSGNVLSPQDNLKFVGTVAKRISYMVLQRPTFKADIYSVVFPGFSYDVLAADKKDIFVQLHEWSKTQPLEDLDRIFESLSSNKKFESDKATQQVVLDVFGLARGSTLGKEVAKTLEKSSTSFPVPRGRNTEEFDYFTAIKNRSVNLRSTKANLSEIIKDKYKGIEALKPRSNRERDERNAKRFGKSGLTERTGLSEEASRVISAVTKAGYGTLASRLGPWFRQFLTSEIQGAVADIFQARLAAFLAEPLTVSREERIAFMDPETFDDEGEHQDEQSDAEPEDKNLPENPDLA